MTSTSVWDDPELAVNDDFYKFDAVGDSMSGVIRTIGTQKWPDGKVDPQLLILDDVTHEDRTLTAGQIRLKMALIEARPNVGDHLSIKLTLIEPRGGGKTLKHFEVAVTPGGQAPPPTAAGPVTTPGVDPSIAAALGNLTPEQRTALGLPPA